MSFIPVTPAILISYNIVPFVSLLFQLLKVNPEEVLIESTGVIGQRIKRVQHLSHSFFCANAPIKLDNP